MTNEIADEEAKPPNRTTAAPVPTTTTRVPPPVTRVTQPGTRSYNDVASSSGSTDNVNKPSLTPYLRIDSGEDTTPSVFFHTFATFREIDQTFAAIRPPARLEENRSGEQSVKPAVLRLDQPRLRGSADEPQTSDPATGRGQGRTNHSYAAPSQLPGPTSATKSRQSHQQEVSTTSQQQRQESPTVKRSPLQVISRKSSVRDAPHTGSRGGGEATLRDVDSQPVPTLPAQSKIEGNRRPLHKVTSPKESSSRQPPQPRAGGQLSRFSSSIRN